MKRAFIKSFFLLSFPLLFTGCQDKISFEYMANVPVYMSYEDLRSSVKQETSGELKDPGKIYFKDNWLFINENMEGVHVIDNSDTKNIQLISKIPVTL